eukprot:TRINITY_DN4436_c0_g1_i1.p1 TRINITY_DN4436_c0_g1~~TRINITY_DN4436_c0_g1_i1.p1  ORF type:complete len:769 (+),score=160.75 TRINITY_DN4436_c0_g1_i1:29-2308(+)
MEDLSIFKEPNFVPNDYIEKITRKLAIKQALDDTDKYDPSPLLRTFDENLTKLRAQSETLQMTIDQMVKASQEVEETQQENFNQFNTAYQQNLQSVLALDKCVYGVGTTIERIGERLEGLDLEKNRIKERKDILQALYELNGDGPPSPLWTDNSFINERSALIKSLNAMIQDLDTPSTEIAKSKVELYSNALENQLLEQFDEGFAQKNYEKMKNIALTLYAFNGGESCIRNYIAKLNMFYDLDSLNHDRELASDLNPKNFENLTDLSDVDLNERQKQITSYFDDLQQTCRAEHQHLSLVFPNPSSVFNLIVHRLFELRLGSFLEVLFEDDQKSAAQPTGKVLQLFRSSSSAMSGPPGVAKGYVQLIFMRTLSSVFSCCLALLKNLSSLCPIPDQHSLLSSLFSEYLSHYFELEIKCLETVYSYPLSRQAEGTEAEEQGLLALFFIRANEEAIQRCLSLSAQDVIPQNVHKLFTTLLSYLGYRYVNEYQGFISLLKKIKAAGEKNINVLADAPVNQRRKTVSLLQRFFTTVQCINQIVLLIQQHFQSSVLPHVKRSINDQTQCIMEINSMLSLFQTRISLGIEMIIKLLVKTIQDGLSYEQQKNDFIVREDVLSGEKCTPACLHAVDFGNETFRSISSCLDNKNLQRVVESFLTQLHKVLINHFQNFEVTQGLGGLKLMRDVVEYKEFASKISKRESKIEKEYECLWDIAKIFIVSVENLNSLLEDSSLLLFEKQILINFLKKRSDYKSSWIGSIVYVAS